MYRLWRSLSSILQQSFKHRSRTALEKYKEKERGVAPACGACHSQHLAQSIAQEYGHRVWREWAKRVPKAAKEMWKRRRRKKKKKKKKENEMAKRVGLRGMYQTRCSVSPKWIVWPGSKRHPGVGTQNPGPKTRTRPTGACFRLLFTIFCLSSLLTNTNPKTQTHTHTHTHTHISVHTYTYSICMYIYSDISEYQLLMKLLISL